ncbi:hypothetical protein [Ruminococcus sp.]|uniref:hypothetical protein n=1 Tax=Ruminococcus sp. TaxID=41978 RepID=UPI0025F8DCC9|nr:hypothetical protein [Ruminococcus sp.]
MGLVLGLGLIIFLIFAVPAVMLLIGSILFFCFWHKNRKTVLLVLGIVSLVLMVICMVLAGIGLLLMYGPLSYGGMI